MITMCIVIPPPFKLIIIYNYYLYPFIWDLVFFVVAIITFHPLSPFLNFYNRVSCPPPLLPPPPPPPFL